MMIENFKRIKRNKKMFKFNEEDEDDIQDLIVDSEQTLILCEHSLSTISNMRNYYSTKLSNDLYHTLALTNFGKLYVWGNNDYGQLGDGTTSRKVSPTVLSMTNYLSNETIVEVSVGRETSFVITSTGKILHLLNINQRD
jgi:alpha-tubulin suppressor-like RCC1 family protein